MSTQERRKYPRTRVGRPLKVVDLDWGSSLGHLVDISAEGFMLIGPEPIEVNRVFQLSLELPEEIGGGQSAYFGAETLWREVSSDPGKYWIGFQIIDISQENIEKIRRLIEECL